MSLNIVAAWPLAIVGVSDRRLTGFTSKAIQTNRSTKVTVFGCSDAHGVIVYNGIGMDQDGQTPSDWLTQLAEKGLFDSKLQDVLEGVKADLEIRLQKLREKLGAKTARHTFVFGVWHNGVSVIYRLTNYEWFDGDENLLEGSQTVKLSEFPPTQGGETRIIATGSQPPKADIESIGGAIKTKPLRYVVARCIKAVRDFAYRHGKAKGTVGAAVQWAVIGPKREEVWCGLDVAGGRIAQEPPNIIKIGARSPVSGTLSIGFGSIGIFKDAYAYALPEDGSPTDIAHYDPVKKRPIFSEPKCGVCGSPWPASHRFCEVCLHDEHHSRGKEQRRKR